MSARAILMSRPFLKLLSGTRLPRVTNVAGSVRQSHVVSYRAAPPPHSKPTTIGAEIVGAAMWWWVIWHLWHEYDHITGEFEYPDASAWSNTELGIPPDNA